MTRSLIVPALLLWTLPALPPAHTAAQENQEERSVLAGVYTSDQAQRGAQVFEAECSFCHAPAEFSGRIFQLTWQGRHVGALYSQIRYTMPLDRPGGLTAAQYAAVVAYILRLNQYPTGETDLPADPEALGLIRFEPPPDPGS